MSLGFVGAGVLAPRWGAGNWNRVIPGPSRCGVPGLGSLGPLGRWDWGMLVRRQGRDGLATVAGAGGALAAGTETRPGRPCYGGCRWGGLAAGTETRPGWPCCGACGAYGHYSNTALGGGGAPVAPWVVAAGMGSEERSLRRSRTRRARPGSGEESSARAALRARTRKSESWPWRWTRSRKAATSRTRARASMNWRSTRGAGMVLRGVRSCLGRT